jgi:subfamily B ATP-binding cassette protein MsbA
VPEPRRSPFFRFLKYVAPYKGHVLLAVLGGIVKFTVPLGVPLLTRELIDHVFLNPSLSADQKGGLLLQYLGGMMLVFVFFWGPWTFVRHYSAAKAGQSSIFDLRSDLYDKVLRMSARFFQRHRSGGLVSRLMSDTLLAQDLVGNALTNVWMDTTALVVILVLLFRIDVSLTLVTLATFPLYLYFFRKLGGKLKQSTHQVQREVESMSGHLQEKMAGAAVVHSFGQEKEEGRRFALASDQLFSLVMRTNRWNSLNVTITGVLTSISPLIVLLYGGWQVVHGVITVGDLVAVTLFLGPLYLPLQRFSELNAIFSSSLAALDRIFEILDEDPDIRSAPDAVPLNNCRGEVEFRDVRFAYSAHRPTLDGVSFTMAPGTRTALVGPSGSGKSTIANLVPRFYDVTSGAVFVDGHDVRRLQVETLRRPIALVLQDPILFSGTLRENLLYGQPDASLADLETACRNANAWEFIHALPQGLETEVGERGTQLSGGQKQRVTIARAFLRDPRILILDEATSSLDSESERLIQDALDRLMTGRTTLVIAHRLSTIVSSDQILVLHQGKIVDKGRHDDLVAREGLYRDLYRKQHQIR